MSPLLLVIPLLLLAAFFYWLIRRRRAAHEPAPCSIVVLLRKAVPVNAHTLAAWITQVTARPIEVLSADIPTERASQPPRDCILSSGPHIVAFIGDTAFIAHAIDHPYVSDPAKAATEIPEMRIAHAVAQHKAWFSLDILHPQQATPENYRTLAQVLALYLSTTAHSECLALYHPPRDSWAPYTDDTLDLLRAADPIAALFSTWAVAPVIPVDDDPRMKTAEAEARRRFPEFEAAFRAGPGNFSVKAAITEDGNTEHIWIEVERIDGTGIHGVLGNEPISLGDLKLGSPITITREQVEDWAYQSGDQLIGAFTVPVIQAIQQDRQGR